MFGNATEEVSNQKHTKKRDLENYVDGKIYSWRKMEAAAEDIAGWIETSDLWPAIHWEHDGISQVSPV